MLVRALAAGLLLLSCGCRPGLVFNSLQMSSQEMLQRATLAFIGVIQKAAIRVVAVLEIGYDWPRSRFREVLEDLTALGKSASRPCFVESSSRSVIDVYEIFWTGGTTGDWNSTQDGQRALFLVRKENGKYHVVRDWWRSIFPVTGGPHQRLPLDETHIPFGNASL